MAHNEEVDSIDTQNRFNRPRTTLEPPPQFITPLMTLHRYKRSAELYIRHPKARCDLRGDLMKPGLHSDPKHTITYTPDRTTQQGLLALHVTYQLPLVHFKITSAYFHYQYKHHTPLYVKQMLRSNSTYKHTSKDGQLIANVHGSPAAFYYYNHDFQECFTFLGHQKSENDPCLYNFHHVNSFTILSTTVDEILVLASDQSRIDILYHEMLHKHKLKRLGASTRFSKWTITKMAKGTHLFQTDGIGAILHQNGMQECNPARTLYTYLYSLDEHDNTTPLPKPHNATTL